MRFTAFLFSVFAAFSLAAEDIQSRIDAAAASGGGVEIAGGDLAVGNRSEAGKTVKGVGK